MDEIGIAIAMHEVDKATADLEKIGSSAESNLGAKLKTAATVGGAALVGFGAAALKISNDYDEAMDSIAGATGKTGDELEALGKQADHAFRTIPVSIQDAATAIGELSAKLGVSGPQLDTIAAAELRLARVTGTDLKGNIDLSAAAFRQWGIASDQQAATLDKVLVASQKTGVGIQTLLGQVDQFGPVLRQFGFSFDQSLALIAQFNRNGVDFGSVAMGMSKALATLAKSGEEPAQALQRVIGEIKNAGDISESNGKAIELFGARAGPRLAEAIRQGNFSIDELVGSLQNADGAIERTAAAQDDWREKLILLKNNIEASIAPYADYAAGLLTISGTLIVMAAQAPAAFGALTTGAATAKAALAALTTESTLFGASVAATLGPLALLTAGIAAVVVVSNQGAQVNEHLSNASAKLASVQADLATATGQHRDNLLFLQDVLTKQIDKDNQEAAASQAAAEATQNQTQATEQAARASGDFNQLLRDVNATLDNMTKAASDAFGALDKFKNVPTQEQLNLNAALAQVNAELANQKVALDNAKAAHDTVAQAIIEKSITALTEEQGRLQDSSAALDANRTAAVEMGKAKEGASGHVQGLIGSESDLIATIDSASASLATQQSAAQSAGDIMNGNTTPAALNLQAAMAGQIDAASGAASALYQAQAAADAKAAADRAAVAAADAAAAAYYRQAAAAETAAQAAALAAGQQAPAPGPFTGPFAEGVTNAPGGFSWVGERGPELEYIPPGASIYPATTSKQMAAAALNGENAGGGPSVVNLYGNFQPVYPAVTNADEFMSSIDWGA